MNALRAFGLVVLTMVGAQLACVCEAKTLAQRFHTLTGKAGIFRVDRYMNTLYFQPAGQTKWTEVITGIEKVTLTGNWATQPDLATTQPPVLIENLSIGDPVLAQIKESLGIEEFPFEKEARESGWFDRFGSGH